MTISQARYLKRLQRKELPEGPEDDRGYWPAGQHLICIFRSSNTSASALSFRESARPCRSQHSAHLRPSSSYVTRSGWDEPSDRTLCPSWSIRLNMKQQENMKHASEKGTGCKGHKGFVVFKHRAESLKRHFVCEKKPWENSVMHWEDKTKICFSS